MKIKIDKKVMVDEVGRLVPDLFIEDSIINNYEYPRNKGTNYLNMLLKSDVSESKEFGKVSSTVKLTDFYSIDMLTSRSYKILAFIDMTLLNIITDVRFKNIKYCGTTDMNYVFEVDYGDN